MSTPALQALAAYRARGRRSLHDKALESRLFAQLRSLEALVDQIGPTSLRHELSRQIVQMRTEIWAYDQSKEF